MSGAIATSGGRAPAGLALRHRREWLALAGMVLVALSLLPPLGVLARRYLFAESIQFSVFAMAGPALIVLGAPWRLLRLSREGPGRASGLVGSAPAGPLDRLAAGRRRNPAAPRASGFLAAFIAVCLAWRLPAVLDGLAHHPWLLAVKLVTLLTAGTGLWLELVGSPPLGPRLSRPYRAALATLAMWFIWAAGYVLGFFHAAVVHAYGVTGGWLGPVADQEVTASLLWVAASCCFMPVIFGNMLSWLRDGGDLGEEFRRMAGRDGRVTVRGWGPPGRRGTPPG